MKRTSSTQNRKLASLLALSAGALAAPEIADATVVWSGEINQKVGFSGGFGPSYVIDLPGSANLWLWRSSLVSDRQVRMFGTAAVMARIVSTGLYFARRNDAGVTWDAIASGAGSGASVGRRHRIYTHFPGSYSGWGAWYLLGPGSFDNKYVAFKFQDSTQGNADRYGWALMSMTVAGGPVGTGPDVTLHSWAYDDGGEKLAMGAGLVPEPSSAALAALGALVLGSRGLRRWRSRK